MITDELSIGDYVLSGGEIPAMVVVDAVTRLIPGALGCERSAERESFAGGLLDHPHYTRPAEVALTRPGAVDTAGSPVERETLKVPGVLLSGNHAEIRRWRKRAALGRTLDTRPDLLRTAKMDPEEQEILRELVAEREKA